ARREGDPGAAAADGLIVDPNTTNENLRHDATNFCPGTNRLRFIRSDRSSKASPKRVARLRTSAFSY
ncbi:MAG: hypothetical protein WA706_02345, partial [Pseudolabrys sp.]